ncbi:acyltransferase family protein [Butyrivibrio fibrisolvens]|uniref:acyltransferase family protein n=1 Tax=Butyrivibrio fibrisolvens TaxID=831 RepID=UPI0003B5A69E|nr:acyltransferase [Butyrivibrio fibrisolvens]
MKNNDRNKKIDVMRGMLITMVVWGHCNLPGTKFVYLFHMTAFIMISGYFYKVKAYSFDQLVKTLGNIVRKYWLQYVIPVVGITIFMYYLKSLFGELYVYEDDFLNVYFPQGLGNKVLKELIMVQAGPFTGQLWFIRNLLIVHVLFVVIDYVVLSVTRKARIRYAVHYLVGSALLLLGFYLKMRGWNSPIEYNVERAMMTYVIYLFGFTYGSIFRRSSKDIVLFVISIPVLVVACNYKKIDLVALEIINPLFFLMVSVCGWLFINYLSALLSKIKLLLKVLSFLGENSYYIFVLHFLMMWIYDITFKDKGYVLGRFLFGLILPVIFYLLVKQIGLKVKESKRIKKNN